MGKKVNTKSLVAHRDFLNLDLDDVSSFMGTSSRTLAAIEAGLKQPTTNQLIKLSELYNVNFYKFLDPEDLKPRNSLADFRKSNPKKEKLSPIGYKNIWKTENRSSFIEELRQELGKNAPETRDFSRITNGDRPSPSELRTAFDAWRSRTSRHTQFSGPKDTIFLHNLRLFMETYNCHTSHSSAPEDDYLGFYSSTDNGAKVIFINRELKNSKRKIFTLAHEIFHRLTENEGVSDPFSPSGDIERYCNRLAAEFLAPDDVVEISLKSLDSATLRSPWKMALALSQNSQLSLQASALRLTETGAITPKQKDAIFAKFNRSSSDVDEEISRKINKKSSPPVGRNVSIGKALSEVGILPAYTVHEAIQHRLIDSTDATRGLGVSEGLLNDVMQLARRRYEGALK